MNKNIEEAILKVFDGIRKDSINITYAPLNEKTRKSLSKIGGKANLPQDFQWPYYEGESYEGVVANRPLAFFAEIHLSELTGIDSDALLPKSGVLSFFYEMETQKWGFDPKDIGCAKVYYFEDERLLSATKFPEDLHAHYHFPEFSLSFERKVSLPSYTDFDKTEQGKIITTQFPEACDWDSYDLLKEQYGCSVDEFENTSKLLGYPDVIQNSMEQECEEVTRGIHHGEPHELPNELNDEIVQASKDWTLLFQMGTIQDEDFELMFGDCGNLYFWIKKKDLAERNFENVWLILQCG